MRASSHVANESDKAAGNLHVLAQHRGMA